MIVDVVVYAVASIIALAYLTAVSVCVLYILSLGFWFRLYLASRRRVSHPPGQYWDSHAKQARWWDGEKWLDR